MGRKRRDNEDEEEEHEEAAKKKDRVEQPDREKLSSKESAKYSPEVLRRMFKL